MLLSGALLASTGCVSFFSLYDHGVNRSLAYRSPIGIRVDIMRHGTPVAAEQFAWLVPGASDLGEALAALGAPHRFRRTPTEEALEDYYVYDRKTRLLVKPLFFMSHGGMASYNYRGSETGTDVVALVFDHEGRLLRKELRSAAPDGSTGAMLESVFVP
jgi:hypothetical protein